ncbi:MAG: 4-(cytidine 5'-diphospho)-2-C-methyl-D-erythritol kinase [Gemmatimonadota bacterium]
MTTGRASTAAPAKVNLFLRVLYRRPDGFRELETLFQSLTLDDDVALTVGVDAVEARTPGTAGTETSRLERVGAVSVRVTGGDVGPAEENLAVRAAHAFLDCFGLDESVHIELTKRIPTGAGLGGGSSDAAAVLRCLRARTGVGSDEELWEIGTELGSDVPFFLTPTALALGRGRGEELTPLRPLTSRPVVLALPPVHVATGPAYATLSDSRDRDDPHGGPRALALQDFASWASIDAMVENDFMAPVADAHPVVAEALERLRRELSGPVLLSGSGGACFGLAESADEADRVASALSSETGWTFSSVSTRSAAPEVRLKP